MLTWDIATTIPQFFRGPISGGLVIESCVESIRQDAYPENDEEICGLLMRFTERISIITICWKNLDQHV
jgi:hypothetical protein